MPGSPRSVIRGTVRDPAGRALAGARLAFVDGPVPLPDLALLSGADGAFSLAAPAPGTYRIACHAEGFAPQTGSVTVGPAVPAATLDFHLR